MRLTLLATLVVALLSAPAALAAPTFRPPVVAGPTASALPSVTTDAAGNAAIAYVDRGELKVVARPAGGAWGQPEKIADVLQGADVQPFAGFDAAGNLTVVWATAATETAHAVTRPAGAATFGPAQQIATGINPGLQMDVDFTRNGAILLVWGRGFGRGIGVVRKPAGGQFEQQEIIGAGGDSPRGSIGEDGTAAVTWHQQGQPAVVAVKPAGAASWEGPTGLGAPVGPLSQPNVAVDAGGNTLAIWIDEQRRINARLRPAGAGQGFGPVDQLADLPGDAYGTEFFGPPQLAMDAAGNATLLFSQINGGGDPQTGWRLFSAYRPAGQAFGQPAAISPEGEHAVRARLAVAPDGTAIATWQQGGRASGDFREQVPSAIVGVHGANGTWSTAPQLLSPSDAYHPAPGAGSSGSGAVAWVRVHDAQCRQLEVSDFAEGAPAALNPPPRSCDPPDVVAPQATLAGKTKQRAHTGSRRAVLTITCDELCTGSVRGVITLKPRRGKSSTLKLAKLGFLADPGSNSPLRFALKASVAKRLATVLTAGGSATLTVSGAASDAAGNTTPVKRTVRLIR